MKIFRNYFLILKISMIFCIGIITSCSSQPIDTNAVKDPTVSNQAGQAHPVEKTENSNINTAAKQAEQSKDGLPEFKKGEDYKSGVREKLLKDGWKPSPTDEAQTCGSGDPTCDEFPEMEACAGTGLGNCKFRWEKNGKILAVFTIDDPQVYQSHEFEKAEKSPQAKQSEQWETFWKEFTTAIDKKDSDKLIQMMSNDFDDGGGGGTAQQWLNSIQQNNSWSYNQKSVKAGTKIGSCDIPCRSTKDGYLLFEYRKNQWLWVGLGGEGGD